MGDDAGQVDGGASVDVEVGVALYPHMGHCNGGQGEARPRLLPPLPVPMMLRVMG